MPLPPLPPLPISLTHSLTYTLAHSLTHTLSLRQPTGKQLEQWLVPTSMQSWAWALDSRWMCNWRRGRVDKRAITSIYRFPMLVLMLVLLLELLQLQLQLFLCTRSLAQL